MYPREAALAADRTTLFQPSQSMHLNSMRTTGATCFWNLGSARIWNRVRREVVHLMARRRCRITMKGLLSTTNSFITIRTKCRTITCIPHSRVMDVRFVKWLLLMFTRNLVLSFTCKIAPRLSFMILVFRKVVIYSCK